ncbi:MAG TPA: SPOCS domain-containing protein, partial [Limnochordia bacterium]
GRPPIGRVLSLELIPVVVEGEAREGSVVVRGAMDVRSLYVASDPSLGVRYEVWPKAIPFEVQCETPDARAGVRIQPQLSLENVSHRVVGGNGEEGLRVTAALSAAAKLTEVCELACVTELFAEEGEEIAVRKEQMQLFELLGERSEQVEAVGTLDVGEGEGGIDRLVCGEARVVPEDIHVLGDRVAVEGALSLTILYSGRSEGQRGLRVGEWPAAIAFQCEIPIDGAEPGMERWVRFGPPRVELDLINRQTIEARATFAVTAGVGREVELEAVVEAVSVPPAVADPPTFTFLVLQDGDTLWKVARQYRTEVEAIVAANPWLSDVEGERLPVGRKLCIPRAKAAGS